MARFAATMTAIDKGLDSVTPEAGGKLVDDWIEQLGGSDKPGMKAVAGDLDRLKKALDKGDSAAIGKLLAKLGAATTKSADKAEGANVDKLRALGEALSSAGSGDGAMEDEDAATAA